MCSRCDDIFGLIEYQTVMLAKSEIMLMFAVVSQTLRGFIKLVVLVRSMTQHPSGSLVIQCQMIWAFFLYHENWYDSTTALHN